MMTAALLLLLAVPRAARAFSWWPDKLASSWAAAPVPLDGADEKWWKTVQLDEPEVSLHAMNDAAHLTLRVAAEGLDGRALLSGFYRQDVTLWFMDGRTKEKAWGIRFPFGAQGRPASSAFLRKDDYPPVPSAAPELAVAQGAAVSTSALPSDIAVKPALSGKNPLFEVSVPLTRLVPRKGGAVLCELEAAGVARGVRRLYSGRGEEPAGKASSWSTPQPEGNPASDHQSVDWGSRRGGRRAGQDGGQDGGRRKDATGPDAEEEPLFPDAISLDVSVVLAPRP